MSISSVSAAVAVCLDVVEPPHLYFQLAPDLRRRDSIPVVCAVQAGYSTKEIAE
jgi:hypothetical protein